MLAILFPSINPIFLSIGPIDIHWYGISYTVSILCCYFILCKIYKKNGQNNLLLDDILFYSSMGIIFGGRIGYVLFYHTSWFYNDILRVFKIWQGGMSFHGGIIGVILAIYFASKKHKTSFLYNCDNLALVAPIGLFFGRIANFINGELFGRITNVSWGIITDDGFIRHPSQIYESFTEGLLLLMIMILCYRKCIKYRGMLSGIFLIFYSIFRILIENFREPDSHLGFYLNFITLGQILSLPMLLLGFVLIYYSSSKN